MTTDAFTTAARAEAEQEHSDDDYEGSGKAERYAFIGGAQWARDHLARQEVTDAELVDLWWTTCDDEWAVPDDVMIAFGRAVLARAALTAAKEARA